MPKVPGMCHLRTPQVSPKLPQCQQVTPGIFCAWRASWLRIVAALGANFSESVAVRAEFCFSGREFCLSLLPIGTLYSKLQSLSNA